LSVFPSTDEEGEYLYSSASSSLKFMNNLRDEDGSNELIGKLKHDDAINFDERVVIIYGAHPDINLPVTVATYGGLPSYITIPIACGPLKETLDRFP